MSFSYIGEIPKRFFMGAPQLTMVIFGHLELSTDGIPDDVFHSSETLVSMTLLDNSDITVLKNTWLKSSAERSSWSFVDSGIQSIEIGAFDNVLNATSITLEGNDLSQEGIPDDLFVKFEGTGLNVRLTRNPRLTEVPPACNVSGVSCIV